MNIKTDMAAFLATLPPRLDGIIRRHAAERPEALSVRDGELLLTYRELDIAVDAAADWLRALGIRPGDRVMLINENSAALIALLFAISRIDAWAVLVNARIANNEIDSIRDHCRPRRVIFTTASSDDAVAHAERHSATPHDLPVVGAVAVSPPLGTEPEPVFESNAEQVAVMIYTTGTTGAPKGVMITHRNLLYTSAFTGAARGMCADDRVYAVLPIAHVFGLTSTVLAALSAGASVEVSARFDTDHVIAALARDITVFQGVPAMYAALLESARNSGKAIKTPFLRFLSVGGAPMDLDLKQRVEAALGIPLSNGYGMTESSPTISINPADRPRTDDSVGIPLEGLELRMVDRDGNDRPAGEVGELWVRGPNIMKGYYRAPEETAKVLSPDGWLNTGDLARLGDDGALYIVGRSKELIIRSGFNVYPPEVEAVLNTHPDVVHSAVVGRTVPGNEEVFAFVQPAAGSTLTEDGMKAFMHDAVAPYKRPSRIIVMDALPAAPTGKILKHKLAERVRNGEFD
ncbi:MAG: AMP-binding protein [Rhodospirillales bacterium]|nr:AMP-binding protein [Rhodospirillales bacterium]